MAETLTKQDIIKEHPLEYEKVLKEKSKKKNE